jgi:glycosyltransferase involved in cell wall biosynthesis
MILGIDATNIRSGGGLTHLKEILNNADSGSICFEKVIVWSNNVTLSNLPSNDWLEKRTHNWLNKSFVFSFIFQIFLLSREAKKSNCTLLFVPGGTFLGSFKNFVAMSQNMLPFEFEEQKRYKSWKSRLRFKILFITQSLTFKRAKAVVFLTNYAQQFITKKINLKRQSQIIPHGISLEFLQTPKEQKNISDYSFSTPFQLLYVSLITVYKHQWNVVEAVLALRSMGYPISLTLVGGTDSESFTRFNASLQHDTNKIINYRGQIQHKELAEIYKSADAFVFASSCENMPIILIEAMTSGLPIASSNKGPMPEILGEAGFYFDPTNVDTINMAIKTMLDSTELRNIYSHDSFSKSIKYTWKECSNKTFNYLYSTAKNIIT